MADDDLQTEQSEQEPSDADKTSAIEVEITDDQLQAFLLVHRPDDSEQPTEADVRAKLDEHGVVTGIHEDLIKFIFEDEMFEERHLIAEGEPPTNGIDGILKYHVDINHDLTPKVDEKGNADYKSVNLFSCVSKGDPLAEIVPPVPGLEGKSVLGETVEPQCGAPLNIQIGEGVIYDTENKNLVVADIDGNVSLKKDNVLTVAPLYIVDGDVDYSTGNIEFNGAIIVTGDVKTDFSVTAKGDIEVQGVVEDSVVKSESNILLKQGCVGKEKGCIDAQGTITSKYCNNHTLKAKGNISIGENVLHSCIETENELIITGKKGAIIGGTILACMGITVNNLGSKSYPKTEVTVGIKKEILVQIEEINKALASGEQNSLDVAKHLFQLNRERKARGELPKPKMALLKKLERLQEHLKLEKSELPKEREKLEQEMQQYANARIRVLNDIFPNVLITILNAKLKITDELKRSQFVLEDGDVRGHSLTK